MNPGVAAGYAFAAVLAVTVAGILFYVNRRKP